MQIIENIAERLFCDLMNASVKIEKPLYMVDGAKIGQFPDSHQLVIFGRDNGTKFNCSEGVTWKEDNFDQSFTEAYDKLLNSILALGNHIKFISLVIPRRGVMEVALLEYERVIGRYIKDYMHMSDETLVRWDFLVQKVTDNEQ